jgi:hypothetical protein
MAPSPSPVDAGAARAQSASGGNRRIARRRRASRLVDAFRQQMRELGYVEGRNVASEPRYAKGSSTLDAGEKLVGLKVAVIVTGGSAAAVASRRSRAPCR